MSYRSSIKGILANYRQPSDFFKFQYNPSSISESKNPNWAEASIPGGNDTLATFGNGGSFSINFDLFLNAFGEGGELPNGDREFVEKSIAFLYRFTETSEGVVGGEQFESSADSNIILSPGILLLSLGRQKFPGSITNTGLTSLPVLPIRITSMEVETIIHDPVDFIRLRASVRLTLTRHSGFPR